MRVLEAAEHVWSSTVGSLRGSMRREWVLDCTFQDKSRQDILGWLNKVMMVQYMDYMKGNSSQGDCETWERRLGGAGLD